jgi:hypothetical protein
MLATMKFRIFCLSVCNLHLQSTDLKIKRYKDIILPAVLYGCETWSLTLREECRLKVSENRMRRRIFGPKRDELTGGWRKLHDKELQNFCFTRYSLGVHIKEAEMGGHIALMWEVRNVYIISVGKPQGKRPL